MKYMFLIYSSEKDVTQEEWTQCVTDSTDLCHELDAKGQFRTASPLHPVATATTVRVRNEQRLVTAGPFAETTEQLGGYYVVDIPDLDEAIAVATRIPPAQWGTVEIRPMISLAGLPEDKSSLAYDKGITVMLICYDNEQEWNDAGPDAQQAAMNCAVHLAHEIDAKGQYLTASPLYPVSTATSVRVRDGKRIVTDGPFAETREVLGGFYLLRVNSIDEAVEIAGRHPGISIGSVEIRQVFEVPNVPEKLQIKSQAANSINVLTGVSQ